MKTETWEYSHYWRNAGAFMVDFQFHWANYYHSISMDEFSRNSNARKPANSIKKPTNIGPFMNFYIHLYLTEKINEISFITFSSARSIKCFLLCAVRIEYVRFCSGDTNHFSPLIIADKNSDASLQVSILSTKAKRLVGVINALAWYARGPRIPKRKQKDFPEESVGCPWDRMNVKHFE